MRKNSIDTVLRVRLKHKPGQLARFATVLAEQDAVLGEITTLRIGEDDSLREITIETADEPHTERVLTAVRAMTDVDLLEVVDRAFECHRGGKLHSSSRVEIRQLSDLRSIYTPGVARIARAIEQDPEKAWEFTSVGNSVGIFTNGSRVLGLGNSGPLASLPVMEGKAVLYDKFIGISATPILVNTLDPNAFVEIVERLSLSFGGIHLEDIRVPDCFQIEGELIRRLEKPVMHDDQHGTATVALAAVINACKLTGIELKRARIGQIGLGAAGSAIARLALTFGVGEVLVHDPAATALERVKDMGAHPTELLTLMHEADIVIATTGRPGLITQDMIRAGQVIFSLSNPEPEIHPGEALAAGAGFAADGRSINNALAFPGLFKGALDVRSKAITPEMMVAAALVIADYADPGVVVPSPLLPEVHQAVRRAAADTARKLGLANTARLVTAGGRQ
jgi:malate dehydrogenase (oxaloacetate-decarboxylating)